MTYEGTTSLVPFGQRPPTALALVTQKAIVAVEEPQPALAEGYLRLTSHILLRARQDGFHIVGVTSALRGEGKTTAALNLAICLGRTQGAAGRVLLVDGDARNRTLSRFIAGDRKGDRTNGVDGEVRPPTMQVTSFPGVDLLTAPTHASALALHDPKAWSATLEALSVRYALLVVDCPSILDSPEGMVLPSCVDEVVMVIRSGQTPPAAFTRALDAISRSPLGVILNGAETTNGANTPRPRRGKSKP